MKITIADTAGFCMGVKRAVDTAFEHVRRAGEPVCTFGPLIHNPQVLDLLSARGVAMLNEIPDKGLGSVIIRAHGIPPVQRQSLANAGFTIIDATCPKVAKVQKIIEKYHNEGWAVIILGEKEHPEIIGLNGYAHNKAHIALNMQELEALPAFERAAVVAQTTLNLGFFENARAWVKACRPHYKIINTICDSTERRQRELQELARQVDGFVIVGGLNSGNTRRLAEVAQTTGKPVLHVESAKDITPEKFAPFKNAGHLAVSAGASTPNWIIKDVSHTLQSLAVKPNSARHLATRLMPLVYLAHAPMALACLTFICQRFYADGAGFLFFVLAFFYGWSMHVTSKISGTRAANFNAPMLTAFYDSQKRLLAASCFVAGLIALVLGFYAGTAVGFILAVSYILRFMYDFWPLARRLTGQYSYFIDMPYTKALCVAVAWGVTAAVLPALGRHGWTLILPVFAWAAFLAYARVMAQDLFALQTDRICGQTTLMLLLGHKKGLMGLSLLLLVLVLWPVAMYYGLGFSPAVLPAMLCPALMLAAIAFYAANGNKISLAYRLEMLVSAAFAVTALIMLFAN